MDTRERVKEANRDFYNKVGARYELYDGRRSDELALYVRENIRHWQHERLLDLGCGSGFVARNARELYNHIYGVDISFRILQEIKDSHITVINADIDSLPFKSEVFDCVVTFATLHHCYNYDNLLSEIFRVLKKGGLYYSDHDMDAHFYGRHRPLMSLYRLIFNAYRRYKRHCPQITKDDYHCSEYHAEGIHSEEIVASLRTIGFSKVEASYHWFGLTSITNSLFGWTQMSQSRAPLLRIRAIK